MNRSTYAVVFVAGLLSLTACTRPAADTPAAPSVAATRTSENAIRAAGLQWNDGYATLNVDAILALYADDAVLMPQTAVEARTPQEIRTYLTKYLAKLKSGPYSFLVPAGPQIRVAGDLGVRWGGYEIRNAAGTAVDTGKWLQVWRKTGDKWQIMLDIVNSDMLPLFPPDSVPPDEDEKKEGKP